MNRFVSQAQAQAAGGEQGMCAIALYDYQAAAEDEISFDPNDIITNIEMVSAGKSVCGLTWGNVACSSILSCFFVPKCA